jgi:hypothetical protein
MKQDFKISYTSKDFDSIKKDLIAYAKRYYSNTVVDFSDASPISLLIDSVAYAGDVLSYAFDYNANETFLDTALERKNILNIGLQNGYKIGKSSTITGVATFYMLLPANQMQPDYRYSPVIRKGTELASSVGQTFILMEDIKITQDVIGAEYTVAEVDPLTNNPTYYAVKFNGNIMSGKITTKTYEIMDFTRFMKIVMPETNVLEIVSIVDSDNNEYYEVETLSQDVVYKLIKNYNNSGDNANFVKPIYAARRFTRSIDENNNTVLTFGGISQANAGINPGMFEPSKTILNKFGREYITDTYIEPNKLISGDNFGIAPSNTTLTITYRVGSNNNKSVGPNSINSVNNLSYFIDNTNLDPNTLSKVLRSIEVTNDETLINTDVSLTTKELKDQIGSYIQAQNRAVTDRDYESIIYSSPSNIGKIRRARVVRDRNSLRNNLNVYVISSDPSDSLIQTSYSTKQNLKNYLNNYRIMTDTIDILDAKIINLGINYEIMTDPNYDSYDVLRNTKEQLKFFYKNKLFIGEYFSLNDIYRELRKVPGLLDVTRVDLVNNSGYGYSGIKYDIESNYTNDKRYLICPLNCIFEIKYLDENIQGIIK